MPGSFESSVTRRSIGCGYMRRKLATGVASVIAMALPSGYELFDEVPSMNEYRRLREVAGLSPKSEAAAAAGLPNSWAAALVRTADGTAVGMAG